MVAKGVLEARSLGLAAVLLLSCGAADQPPSPSRGVSPLRIETPPVIAGPSGSVGLFVGVREFPADSDIPEVPYAVDDAIDLAYLLAIPGDLRRQRILPHNVRLALSGEPQKPESKARLAALVAGGARVSGASRSEIENWLAESDDRTPALLWVSFASHGLSHGQAEYLLTADSHLARLSATALPSRLVLEQIARRPAALRLIVLDACRELMSEKSTRPALDLTVSTESNGPLAVLRARAGGRLFDDHNQRQGVFTRALLDGLDCRAESDDDGYVTVAFLATYVNQQVVAWMRDRLGLRIEEKLGVEANLGGTAAEQPLVRCHECPRAEQPHHLAVRGERVEVVAADGRLLWSHTTSGQVSHAEIADLDGDGSQEVAMGVTSGGVDSDSGWIFCFTCRGKRLWQFNTYTQSPYGLYSGRMAVTKLVIADLFRDRYRQIIALSIDGQAWLPSRLTVLDHEGKLIGSYWHPGHLELVAVGPAADTSPQRIIVGGINNNLRGAFEANDYVDVVFLLDPQNVRGQAPPHVPGSDPGSQLWYRAIIPNDPQVLPPKLLELDSIEILDPDRDGNREIHVRLTEGHSITFDFKGCPIRSGRGDGARGEIVIASFGDDFRSCQEP